jgi:4-diphosphocytidyl-2-C-methyl-D-erythritol kinase
VVRLAPAKVNLTLAVIARRDDGYHSLHSVLVPLGLADRLSFALAEGDRDTLHVTGADTGPPEGNLVLKALAATRGGGGNWSGGPRRGRRWRSARADPVAAGLAGGSSDAAATIDGALEAWAAELDPEAQLRVAARIGSDVPFFLAGGPALVEGRVSESRSAGRTPRLAGCPAGHRRSRSRRRTSSPHSMRSGAMATAPPG